MSDFLRVILRPERSDWAQPSALASPRRRENESLHASASPSRTSTKITVQAMPLAAYDTYLMRARPTRWRSHMICRAAYTTTIADTAAMPAMAHRLLARLACATGPGFVKTCATMTAIATTATVSRFAVRVPTIVTASSLLGHLSQAAEPGEGCRHGHVSPEGRRSPDGCRIRLAVIRSRTSVDSLLVARQNIDAGCHGRTVAS
jgi:hypothetical protein